MGVTYIEINPPYTAHINTAISYLPLSTQEKEIVIKKNNKKWPTHLKINKTRRPFDRVEKPNTNGRTLGDVDFGHKKSPRHYTGLTNV